MVTMQNMNITEEHIFCFTVQTFCYILHTLLYNTSACIHVHKRCIIYQMAPRM